MLNDFFVNVFDLNGVYIRLDNLTQHIHPADIRAEHFSTAEFCFINIYIYIKPYRTGVNIIKINNLIINYLVMMSAI